MKELLKAETNIKNFSIAAQIPRGMENPEAWINLLLKKNVHETVFKIGNFIWKKAQTTERIR